MKESISYSFLLNIIILFITVCAAIIMGIFSYYKAFRANSIITETIEKYEGYNCIAKEEIARKLGSIGYNTPFNVKCKNSDGNCETDNEENGNYKVISYNLDFDANPNDEYVKNNLKDYFAYGEKNNSTYKCDEKGCTTNKHYQYGVYTYMYVELPVVSNLIRLTFSSKTKPMYEHRNFYVEKIDGNTLTTNVEDVFDKLYTKQTYDNLIYVNDAYKDKETGDVVATQVDNPDGTTDWTITTENATKKTATQIMAELSLKLYAIKGSNPSERFKSSAFFTSFITSKTIMTYRNIAIMNKMGIDSNSGTMYGQIMSGGIPRNSNERSNLCGYVMDYDISLGG